MAQSKIDIILEESPELEELLTNRAVSHTQVAEMLDVNEASVRRWRKKNEDLLVSSAPQILIWDIETSPILGYTWGLWEQNVLSVVQDWKLMTVSWTWYGSDEYHTKQLCDFDDYYPGNMNDYELTVFVRDLLSQADYSVAHNGNAFDVKKVNAKFAEHGITPPSPHVQIDTLSVARRNMKMSSNKLDSLGATLGVGRKVKHPGFDMWIGCMDGEPEMWEKMRVYARQDVVLLEDVFEKLLPWIKGLNYNHFMAGFLCTNCGSNELEQESEYLTPTTKSPAWACKSCGTWNKQTRNHKP